MTVCAYSLKNIPVLKVNYFSLKLFWSFSFKIDCITLGPGWIQIRIRSKLGQNPGSRSGSKFNVFGSTTPQVVQWQTFFLLFCSQTRDNLIYGAPFWKIVAVWQGIGKRWNQLADHFYRFNWLNQQLILYDKTQCLSPWLFPLKFYGSHLLSYYVPIHTYQ